MSFSTKQRADFDAAIHALITTVKGKEATMYTALRDLFVDVLGYPKTGIVVDTAGTRGRPDLTVYAPGGTLGSRVSGSSSRRRMNTALSKNPQIV